MEGKIFSVPANVLSVRSLQPQVEALCTKLETSAWHSGGEAKASETAASVAPESSGVAEVTWRGSVQSRRGARQGLSLGKRSQVGRCRRQCRLDRQGMEVGGAGSLLHSSREEWKVRRPSHLPERPILRKPTQ